MDLIQRRNHILKAAFDDLNPDARMVLARIALISEAVDYETLVELSPHRPNPPQVVQAPEESPDYKERKAAYEQYQKDPTAWRQSSALVEAGKWLGVTLQDLESRGLLQWDRKHNKYDLHPVVRGYAVSSIAPEQREGVAQKVVDHFSSRSDGPYDRATSLNDLRNGLQVARTLLHIGKAKLALDVILRLASAVLFNLEAYDEFFALMRPLIPSGWRQPALGIEGIALSRLWNALATALSQSGNPREAIEINKALVALDIDLDRPSVVLVDLRNLTEAHQQINELHTAHRLGELTSTVTPMLGDKEDLALACLRRFSISVVVGNFDAAKQWWTEFDGLPRPQSRDRYGQGEGEGSLALLRFYQGCLNEELLLEVQHLARGDNNRVGIRGVHGLRGEWKLSLGRWAKAASAFEEAIRMTREVNLSTWVYEARLALAQAKLGRIREGRETADRLSESGLDVSLAEFYLALGDREEARKHVYATYEWAWADGEPYVNWWYLQRCRKVLKELGQPEPQFPPFDPATAKPFPFEAKLLAYVEKKRKEKEEKEENEKAQSKSVSG
jgi:tetratricopeptide (TPR) repeat protein